MDNWIQLDIIDRITNQVVEEIKNDIRTKQVTSFGAFFASGKLESSIRYTVTETEIAIYGESYYKAGEDGYKGRVSPSAIREWLRNKNIIYKKGLEYAIAKNIEKKGTLIFRQGGHTGLFSSNIGADSFYVQRVQSELQFMASNIIYNTALTLIR